MTGRSRSTVPTRPGRSGFTRFTSRKLCRWPSRGKRWPAPWRKPITPARSENQFLEIVYRSGKRDHLYRGDLASGADHRRHRRAGQEPGHQARHRNQGRRRLLSRDDLLLALQKEYAENDLFPPTDVTEDWLKLTDFDPDNVIKLGPIRPRPEAAKVSGIV